MHEISPFWSFLVVSGFIGWLSFAFAFFLNSWDEDDNFHPPKAAFWGTLFIVAYGVWVVGLYNA